MTTRIGSTPLDADLMQEGNAGPAIGSVLGNSLRKGALATGAGLSQLAADTDALTGLSPNDAPGFVRGMLPTHESAAGLRARANAISLPVESYKDVHSVGDALKYGVGLAGQSAVPLAAGLAGAALARNPMVGMTLASAPFAAGDIASRQAEDPTLMANTTPGQRLAEAGLTGLRNAALQSIVPVMAGGRLTGATAREVGSMTGSVARNLGENVVGNAGAGVVSEMRTQHSLSALNPNRDTSGDRDAQWEAGIGGAAMGVPFAGMGIAGDAMHGTRPAPRTDGQPMPPKAGETAAPSMLDRAKNVFADKPITDGERIARNQKAAGTAMEGPDVSVLSKFKNLFKDTDLSDAERIAKNQETVDADMLKNASPDAHEGILKDADASRMAKVKDWANRLYDTALSPEQRASLDGAINDLSDRANQSTIAKMMRDQNLTERASKFAADMTDHVSKKFAEADIPEHIKKATDWAREAYDDHKLTPEQRAKAQWAMEDMADTARQSVAAGIQATRLWGRTEGADLLKTGRDKVRDVSDAFMEKYNASSAPERMAKAKKWAEELYNEKLSPEHRAALESATKDLSDQANQAKVAGIRAARDWTARAKDFAGEMKDKAEPRVREGMQSARDFAEKNGPAARDAAKEYGGKFKDAAKDAGERISKTAKEFYDSMGEKYNKATKGKNLSEDSSGLHDTIENVIKPVLSERHPGLVNDPKAMRNVSESLRKFMAVVQKEGTIDEGTASHLTKLFGDDTPAVLAELHSNVLQGADPKTTDKYFAALNKLTKDMDSHKTLGDLVKSHMTREAAARATPDMIDDAVTHIRDFVTGAHTKNMTPAQADFFKRSVNAELQKHFGDQTDAVLQAFADREVKGARGQEDNGTPKTERAKGSDDAFGNKHVNEDAAEVRGDGHENHGPSEGDLSDVDMEHHYYGGGRDPNHPQFMLSEDYHRKTYGNDNSQAAKVKARAQAENPDMNVRYMSVREFAQRTGTKVADLVDATKGDIDNHVIVVAEGAKRDGLTWRDVDRVKLDTHRWPDSASRIDTEEGTVLDAKKVLNMYAQGEKLARNSTDERGARYRMARQFKEAIGALSDHLGEAIEVDDHVVVATRQGKPITWGELQKETLLKNHTPEDQARAAMYKEREAALKAGDSEMVKTLDDKLDAEVMKANDPQDELVDGLKKTEAGTKLKLDRAEIAKKLGAARAKVEEAMKKAGDRGTDPNDLKRQALSLDDMVERLKKAADDAPQKDLFSAGEQASWSKRADALRDAAKVIEASGGQRRLTMKERAAIRDYLNIEKNYEQTQKRIDAREPSNRTLDKEQRSMSDAPLDRNIHEAEAEHGNPADRQRGWKDHTNTLGDKFAGSREKDAESHPLHDRNFETPTLDGSLPKSIRSAIESRITRLEGQKTDNGAKNKIAWAVAAKARALFGALDSMKKVDQGVLASIVKDGKLSSIAETVNGLHAKYKSMLEGTQAKKPNAFTQRVLGEGDLSATISAIKASKDAGKVRQVIDSLVEHATNPRAKQVLDAANERMTKMMERGGEDFAYENQRFSHQSTGATSSIGIGTMDAVRAHIDRVLGGSVDTEFKTMLHAGEFVRDANRTFGGFNKDVIKLSVRALDPMSVAYHESLHAFLAKLRDSGLMDAASPLMKAADNPQIITRLRKLLDGQDAAIRQVENNLEERAAYMYQFWAAGKLDLGASSHPFAAIGKMIMNTMGLWTNDQRALHIMQYFNSGEYATNMANRNAVHASLMKGTNGALEHFKTMAKPLSDLSMRVAATGDGMLRTSNIPALVEMADKVYGQLVGEKTDPGYMPAARAKRTQVLNELSEKLGAYSAAHITDALESLQKGMPGGGPEERLVMREVRKTLDGMFDYMREAGVQVNDLGYGKDYFPRQWDMNAVMDNEPAFRAMLQQYKDAGKFDGSIDQIFATLTRADGSELQVETVRPGMQHTKERVLGFIRGEDAAPFLEKNLYRTLNSYVTQATRRAEFARRFDDTGAALTEMMDQARKEGATREQLQQASDYLQGVDGTLGDKMNPKLRRAFGNMMVYQNVRLLPLAIFSSLIDPMGILVRGGTVKETFKAFTRGIKEIPDGFKKNVAPDEWKKLAQTMGVIDNSVLLHTLGSSYTQGMTGELGRKINDTFFKYNLMEQYNTSMRVAATESAVSFLARHADGSGTHSERWLAELGYKPGEMIIQNDRPLMTYAEFKAHGMSDTQARVAADKMTLAVNKWVDGAVLRPNAAHKPVWMNDPHFALVAHLKQFVYSFQHTILKRVVNEARYGNIAPAYALAAYVPFMMAADAMKGMIVGGGSQPAYKEGWDAEDYLFSGVQRAGLFGVGQFGVDVAKDIHRGGYGIGALAGPTIEQLGDALSTVGGTQQFKTFAMNALPANQLFDAAGEAKSTLALD